MFNCSFWKKTKPSNSIKKKDMYEEQYNEAISKLSQSIIILENSIEKAKEHYIQEYGEDHSIFQRLNQYESGINKQKEFIKELKEAIKNNNQEETERLYKLIDSISTMIKDDVRSFTINGSFYYIDTDMLH